MAKSRTRIGSQDGPPVAETEPPLAEERSGRPPVTKLPDRAVQLTAKRCLLARSADPVVGSFLHVEHLRSGIRKMTREAWDAELEAFKSAPR